MIVIRNENQIYSHSRDAMKCSMILLSVFFILFALPGCEETIPEREVIRSVRAIQVTDSSEFASRSFPGQAKATQEVDLSFRAR